MPPPRRSRRSARERTTAQLLELATTAPLVAATRLSRMALAGPLPSAADRREFSGMLIEKPVAFAHSWTAIWAGIWTLQAQLAWSWLSPATGAMAQARRSRLASAGLDRIAAQGLAPWHRKVTANARRLRR
ncbi:MAG TPA: polyhydroxyalkanoate granule-associated phasin [Luteimonas sp.]|nr:polyhydroxyalkanoate granule-associated phasin [Luteimonas sp.]